MIKLNTSYNVRKDFECTNIDLENDDEIVNKYGFESVSVNNIDSKEFNESKVDVDELNENEIDSGILQLKSNVFPRGLVPLEDLFDFNDVAKKPKIEASGKEVEECNIGIEEKPKMIKLSKSLPPKQKHKYVEIFKEYVDAFT
jgi:adenylate cyclase class IV